MNRPEFLKTGHPDSRHVPRCGTALIMVLVVIIILGALTGQLTRRSLMDRRQARSDLNLLQVEAAVQAGELLARQILQRNPDWQGTRHLVRNEKDAVSQTDFLELTVTVSDDHIVIVGRRTSQKASPIQLTRRIPVSP